MIIDIVQTGANTAELLPWHLPAVRRLVVTLDTKNGIGSDIDGFFGSTFGG